MENLEHNEDHEPKKQYPRSKDAKPPPKICYNYAKYKHCNFGTKCKFLHGQKSFFSNPEWENQLTTKQFKCKTYYSGKVTRDSDREITKVPNARNSHSSKTSLQPKLDSPVCRFFKAGHCNYGDRCPYNHQQEHNFPLDVCLPFNSKDYNKKIFNSKKKSTPVCRYFQRGKCSKDDQCQYFHPRYPVSESDNGVSRQSRTISDGNTSHKAYKAMPNLSLDVKGSDHGKIPFQQSEIAFIDTGCDSSSFNQSANEAHHNNESLNYTQVQFPNQNIDSKVLIDTQSSVPFDNSKDTTHLDNVVQIDDNMSRENMTKSDNTDACGLQYKDVNDTSNQVLLDNDTSFVTSKVRNNLYPLDRNKNAFPLTSLREDEIWALRLTELTQFKKRFPHQEVIEENKSFSFSLQPSDPDWPYELQCLKILVTFPGHYPIEMCEIEILETADYMPGHLSRYLNQSVSDWLTRRHEAFLNSGQVELSFRPFLKWFDRNLEELFKCGLNREQESVEVKENSSISILEETSDDNSVTLQETSTEQIEKDISQISIDVEKNTTSALSYVNQSQGVKILFGGLEFVEGVAAMSCTRMSSTLQCARCKTLCNVKSMPNKNYSLTCSKCSRNITCNFNPSIMHPFSNVLGTLYLTECRPLDVNLVECAFLMDCLSCSKQVTVDSIHYGQKQKSWCKFCNQKFVVGIGSAKFQAAGASYSDAKETVKIVSKSEKKKDPLMKEGLPLPEYGACKHYKKSNRWLRFPCCGRVYPCDVCHDDKEVDHEMKFASRMICGFCSKEQPYSKEKPCISCSSGMVAKSSAHWEGGQGCRNKIKMSRDDKHKFAGSHKTTSNKAKNSGNKKKK